MSAFRVPTHKAVFSDLPHSFFLLERFPGPEHTHSGPGMEGGRRQPTGFVLIRPPKLVRHPANEILPGWRTTVSRRALSGYVRSDSDLFLRTDEVNPVVETEQRGENLKCSG